MTYLDAEREAEKRLHSLNPDFFLALFEDVDQAVTDVLASRPHPLPRAAHVAMMIVMRLKQDLYAVRRLLSAGLPVQGMSLSAGMVELAYELMYLRNHPARIDAWHEHRTLDSNPFKGVGLKARIRDGLSALGFEGQDLEDSVTEHYALYGTLCAAKHGNPMLQKTTGGVVDGDTLTLGPQDYRSDMDVQSAVFALHAAYAMTLLGTKAFAYHHIPDFSGLMTLLDHLRTRNNRLVGDLINDS